jgi:hypothetical protein
MSDRYTKSVLTIIAAALSLIAAQGSIRPSSAQIGVPQEIQICDFMHHCLLLSEQQHTFGSITTKTYTLPIADERSN